MEYFHWYKSIYLNDLGWDVEQIVSSSTVVQNEDNYTLLNKLIRDLNIEAQYVPNVIIHKEESISER